MLCLLGIDLAAAALLAVPRGAWPGRAGVACALLLAAGCASLLAVWSCVACVEQPAKSAATAAAMRSRWMCIVTSLVNEAPLWRRLYLHKCVRRHGGYHGQREKARSAAP